MKKERIVCYGIGELFYSNIEEIQSRFEVVACSDSKRIPTDKKLKELYVKPEKLGSVSFDVLLICSNKWYLDIRDYILSEGIASPKAIMDLESFEMEKTINKWISEGRQIPPPDEYKHLTVREYAKSHSCNTLIETGTYYGGMIMSQLNYFERIVSIELAESFYNQAREKFENCKNVELVYGDSGEVLDDVVEKYNDPIAFWLDGHYSGGDTAKGTLETPIIKEIEIISNRVKKGVLLIDDARCFTGEHDYPNQSDLKDYIKNSLPVSSYEVLDDIIRVEW